MDWLNKYAGAKLTGTGACIFASFDSEEQAKHIADKVPQAWQNFVAKGLNKTRIEEDYWAVAKR